MSETGTSVKIGIDRIATPLGKMLMMVRGTALVLLEFDDEGERDLASFDVEETANPCGYSDRIRAYFDGELAAIDSIPTEGAGTPFQQRVWSELRRIPCGTTLSYGGLAERLGDKNLMRAVGLANGSNPIAVVVPCHRVIGADGSLTGYGGGLPRKSWLLNHEGVPVRNGRIDRQGDLFE
ncbi:methylated-DNA--[protein]-cysteine S-methyltransferase [soil metagenome]